MKKALISPNETVSYISSWELIFNKYEPVYTEIGERVAEVVDQVFEVAPPLFWVDCADTVTAVDYYYDPQDMQIKIIPDPAPMPENAQPSVSGVQTL